MLESARVNARQKRRAVLNCRIVSAVTETAQIWTVLVTTFVSLIYGLYLLPRNGNGLWGLRDALSAADVQAARISTLGVPTGQAAAFPAAHSRPAALIGACEVVPIATLLHVSSEVLRLRDVHHRRRLSLARVVPGIQFITSVERAFV